MRTVVWRGRDGGVASSATPFHLINISYMSIFYSNKDSTSNQDDIKETEVETNLVRQIKEFAEENGS